MAENAAYQCMENGGGKHAHIDMFVAHSACRVQCWDKVMDLDGSLENMLTVFSVLYVTRMLSNCKLMGAINALIPYNCTKRLPLTFPAVTCRTCHLWALEKYGKIPIH